MRKLVGDACLSFNACSAWVLLFFKVKEQTLYYESYETYTCDGLVVRGMLGMSVVGIPANWHLIQSFDLTQAFSFGSAFTFYCRIPRICQQIDVFRSDITRHYKTEKKSGRMTMTSISWTL